MEESSFLSGLEFDSSTLNSRSSSLSSSIQTEATKDFSIFIQKLGPILVQMNNSFETTDQPEIHKAIDSLGADYNRAKEAINSPKIQSSPAKHIEYLIHNLGRSLGLVLFASREVQVTNKQKIEALCKEMMNVRFDITSDFESEFENEEQTEVKAGEKTEETTGEITGEKTEEDAAILSIDDAIVKIKYGNEQEFKHGLMDLSKLIIDCSFSKRRIDDEDIIKVLSKRLSSNGGNERATIIQILRHLLKLNDKNKEKMKDLGFLSSLVKSLARDEDEQREAVGLLLSLSDDAEGRRRMGRIPGCILMLVAISNRDDDDEASSCAKNMLKAMSNTTQHALHMAEAGYFKPLINYLKEGSDMSKVLMATSLSRMELTDQNKASIGQQGAIQPLVEMFKTGNLESKLSSLNALRKLSNSKQNVQHLIHSGIVPLLLELLFSVTSVLMTLREPASAILAKISQSETILIKHDIAHQMLSLLTLSNPGIQNHLLEALNNIASHLSASKVRKKMKENGAIRLLSSIFTDTDSKIRRGALKLVCTLSKDIKEELTEQLGYKNIDLIARNVCSSTSDIEKEAALGILSNLPISDRRITDILKNANLMHAMVSIMSSSSTSRTVCLSEGISGILIRFTVPTDKRLQHYSVQSGAIPLLLKLLSIGSEIGKSNAALCLSQLSKNSLHLSKSHKMKWFCAPPTGDHFCEVHDGYCSIKSTFCLVKAGAITPLLQILENNERGADEAALNCLSTLLQDEIWESGCSYIVKKIGVHPIIKAVQFGSLKSQEKALSILEKIFRIEAYRAEYGESAQGVLIDLAQKGDPMLKPTVAKLLAQLELLQDQSTYF